VPFLRDYDDPVAERLSRLIGEERVLACGPVVAEVLQGASVEARPRLERLLAALPWAELTRDAWLRVGQVAGALRARGITVPLTDVEIAVTGEAVGAALWTLDSDFLRIREALPRLDLFEPEAR